MALVLHAAAQELNLRIVAPDRPGVGESSHKPQRTVVEYPADIAELCDQLGRWSLSASVCGGRKVVVVGRGREHQAVTLTLRMRHATTCSIPQYLPLLPCA